MKNKHHDGVNMRKMDADWDSGDNFRGLLVKRDRAYRSWSKCEWEACGPQ